MNNDIFGIRNWGIGPFSQPDRGYSHAYERYIAACNLTQKFDRDKALRAAHRYVQGKPPFEKRINTVCVLVEDRTTTTLWRMLHDPSPRTPFSATLHNDDGIVHHMLFPPQDTYRSSKFDIATIGFGFPRRSRASHLMGMHRNGAHSLNSQILSMAFASGPRYMLDWTDPREGLWSRHMARPWEAPTSEHIDSSNYTAHSPLLDLFEAGVWSLLLVENLLVLVPIPTVLKTDEAVLLHGAAGPAIEWLDVRTFAWHGVVVEEKVITHPETITVGQINTTRNVETRRVLMERMGYDRYIAEAGAKVLAQNTFGTIWYSEIVGDEDMYVIEVVNSTPEPDGHHKHYFLRFDPAAYSRQAMVEPQAAIASTWRNRDGSMLFGDWTTYRPLFES